MKKKFRKYHSYGNDFILMEEEKNNSKQVSILCDRYSGVGAAILILIKEKPLTMTILNQDASLASMCGNGLCCMIQASYEDAILKQGDFIQTRTQRIQPCIINEKPFESGYSLDVIDCCYKEGMYFVFVGTQHCVLFEAYDEDKAIELCHIHKANINFVEVLSPTEIHVTTYEVGVGLTQACGTGACACAYTSV